MSEKRLGGKDIEVEDFTVLDQVHVHQLPSMEAARGKFLAAFKLPQWAKKRSVTQHWDALEALAERMMRGDNRLENIIVKADELIDQALLIDPRLVRRSGWVMAEEGIDACPAMIAAGEERAYIDRRKMRLADQAVAAQSVRIVISTDSKHITPDHASAFIAAAKLAQQFRPLEIWWQGAWLKEDDQPDAGYGHVFLVPLVNGDLDFSRLQFVLSDEARDRCSFFVMATHAFALKKGWGGKVGEHSYLPDTYDFIRESGITASPEQVAAYAAYWAGLGSRWDAQISDIQASQFWWDSRAEPPKPMTPAEQKAAQKRSEQYERDCEAQRKRNERAQSQAAKERLAI